MNVITIRDVIRGVAGRWKKQYFTRQGGEWRETISGNSRVTYQRLCALDTETCTAGDVAEVIGNTSWTNLICDECKSERLEWVLCVGEAPDYESNTAYLCARCLQQASILLPVEGE